ncbi:hypothetical protein ACWCQQ_03745 [Streptomyces sp. NPDC002143]
MIFFHADSWALFVYAYRTGGLLDRPVPLRRLLTKEPWPDEYDLAVWPVPRVVQVQAENLARPQVAVEHQQNDRLVAQAAELRQQGLDLIVGEQSRNPLHGIDAHDPADRTLLAGPAHERAVPLGDSRERRVRPLLQRVGPVQQPGQDRVFLEHAPR